ncbi:MAG: ParB/RepB/Spo0J family partition protein [Burkholderiales bacterium]
MQITDAGERLLTVDLNQLEPGRYQPRTHMDQTSLAELADSIKEHGVMQPILVRALTGDKFEIIAGERRWRAAKIAGLVDVQVIACDIPNESALAMALIENIQREDLNPMEQAFGLQRLIDEFNMTHETAAKAVSRSRSAVTNLLRLTQLARPVQDLVMLGKLDMGHARALLSLSGAKQVALANQAVAKDWSVREIERHVAASSAPPKIAKTKSSADNDTRRLEYELSEKLGTTVQLKADKNGRGTLTIRFHNLEHLDGILEKTSLK